MRILVFHGYLLGGTGSNVYNACLAAALAGLGHEVHLLCQDRAPEGQPFVDAVGDWDSGELRVRVVRQPVRVTVYRPQIGGLLPVYVRDRYAGFEVRTFGECTAAELESYIASNAAAVGEVARLAEIDLGLANHLIMGPVILARGLPEGTPYAVKVHGSALEYSVKPDPERFLPFAREGLAGARGVLVGSRHTAESLWSVIGDDRLAGRTRLGPPGVDVARFARREPAAAAAGVHSLARRLSAAPAAPAQDGFGLDPRAAGAALARLDPERDRIVSYTGKLIVSKGVDLLLVAWPLVLERVPAARLVIVGFGAYRAGLEQIVAALAAGDLAGLVRIAQRGRELEGGTAAAGPLRMILAFLDGLRGVRAERYWAAAAAVARTTTFTGRLEHPDLAELLPACAAQVVPSTFPEAFGMVAAEAAACGVLPVSADHSGLAEVSRRLAQELPASATAWLSFRLGGGAVEELASRLIGWLTASERLAEQTRAALAGAAGRIYSWEVVAEGVLAAAEGRLDGLARP